MPHLRHLATTATALVLAICCLAAPASAQRVRPGHPRLLFTKQEYQRIKQNAKGPGREFFRGLERYARTARVPTGNNPAFLTDATEAQKVGFWRLPSAAVHYALTGNKESLAATVAHIEYLLKLKHWETGKETDCGMGAANIMVGAAIAYDCAYSELDPRLREAFRRKLVHHAKVMYEQGHQKGVSNTHYWQNDPQNNHRFHRNAGLVLCTLAAAEGRGDAEALLPKVIEELKFVHQWLPEDGTCHESATYMAFGYQHLTLAFDVADRCLGSEFLKHDFFKNAVKYRIQTLTPGLVECWRYGDTGRNSGSYNSYNLRLCALHGLRDEQAAILAAYKARQAFLEFDWFNTIWFDPSQNGGSIARLPQSTCFPDLGICFMRDGWEAGDVGAMFKCGPLGGHLLNEYRNHNGRLSINVAHDDPDANIFEIWADGAMLAEDDGYAEKKMTNAHNTILVNGEGQKGEGHHWTQPYSNMDEAARLVAWKDAGPIVIAEGEAGGAYDRLRRYRRTFVWVRGRYILVLDEIIGMGNVTINWLLQGPGVEQARRGDEHHWTLTGGPGGARCPVTLVCDRKMSARVTNSPAQHRGKPMGFKQLQAQAEGKDVRFVSVYGPWSKEFLDLKVDWRSDRGALIKVAGGDVNDTWQWTCARSNAQPCALSGLVGNTRVALGSSDRPKALP